MSKCKISVIIPIYKAESYLRKCVDSVLNQTYQDIEVILVDDGSPDRCPAICDEYVVKDSRVKVIHQKNAGQAKARNVGISAANGDYITFVDSDDWIELNTFETVYNVINNTQSVDIVLYGHVEEYSNKKVERGIGKKKYSSIGKIKEGILWDDIGSYARNVYKRKLWDGVKFPENCYYEDFAIIIDVFMKANSVEILDECLYHYNFTNPNATTRQWSAKSKYGMFIGAVKRVNYAKQFCNEGVLKKYLKFAYKTCVTGLSMDSISHVLWSEQRGRMRQYLVGEDCRLGAKYVGMKYKLLHWGLLNCILIPKIYGHIMNELLVVRKVIHR